jgi:hypothetical protein
MGVVPEIPQRRETFGIRRSECYVSLLAVQASGTSPVDLSRLCPSAFRLSRAHDLGSGSTDNVSNQPAGIVETVEDIDPRTWYLHAGGSSRSGLGRCRGC